MINIAKLASIPDCDICEGMSLKITATYDAPTVWGPWAYLCQGCYAEQGSPEIASKLELATH